MLGDSGAGVAASGASTAAAAVGVPAVSATREATGTAVATASSDPVTVTTAEGAPKAAIAAMLRGSWVNDSPREVSERLGLPALDEERLPAGWEVRVVDLRISLPPSSQAFCSFHSFSSLLFSSPATSSRRVQEKEGIFTFFMAMQTNFQSIDIQMSPLSRFDDGVFYLLLGEDMNSCSMTCNLLALDADGSVRNSSSLAYFPVRAFRLDPDPPSGGWDEHLEVDGELIPYGRLQAGMLRGVLRLYTGWRLRA